MVSAHDALKRSAVTLAFEDVVVRACACVRVEHDNVRKQCQSFLDDARNLAKTLPKHCQHCYNISETWSFFYSYALDPAGTGLSPLSDTL